MYINRSVLFVTGSDWVFAFGWCEKSTNWKCVSQVTLPHRTLTVLLLVSIFFHKRFHNKRRKGNMVDNWTVTEEHRVLYSLGWGGKCLQNMSVNVCQH